MNNPIATDSDSAFLGVNARDNPLVLQPGILADAMNVRLDRAQPTPRKGSARLARSVLVGSSELDIPFDLVPDKVVTSLSYADGVVTATCVGHGYTELQFVNLRGDGPDGWYGDFRIHVVDADHFSYALPSLPDMAATNVTADGMPVDSLVYAGGTVTATAYGHGFATGRQPLIKGNGASQWFGAYVITVIDADHFTYAIGTAPSADATNVLANGGPAINDAGAEAIHACGVYESAFVQEAREYLVLAGTGGAYLLNFAPGGNYLAATADDDDTTVDSDELTVDSEPTGVPTIYLAYPAGETIEDDDVVTVLQAVDSLYIFRGRDAVGAWKWQEPADVTFAGGVVTVHLPGHGLVNGRVRVAGADQSDYNVEVDITVTDVDHFTYPIATVPATTPATGTIRVRPVKPPMRWDGTGTAFVKTPGGSHAAGPTYAHLPSSGIACWFNSQMAVVRERDEMPISDVLDPDTFDPVGKSFRANAGGNDAIVAAVPYTGGQLFLPCKRSLYAATIVLSNDGLSIDYAASNLRLLSPSFGCRAKDSVIVAGESIFWLSPYGVHMLSNLQSQDLALRALATPLSKPVDPWFEQVNWAYAYRAKAAWHNNRYWLAVPTGTNQWPDTIFVWSSLTGGWESRDTYPFAINFLIPAQFNGEERLFACTRDGGVFLLEERDFDDQTPTSAAPIVGVVRTRQYQWDDMGPKRIRRVLANAIVGANGTLAMTVSTYNPDASLVLATVENASAATNDYSVKSGIGLRGHYADVVVSMTGSSTRLRQLALEAVMPLQPPDSATRTAN
jgi:hypothetical protein